MDGATLAEASWVKEGSAIGRHRVGLPGCRIQKLFESLKSPRQLSVLLHDLLVSSFEEVYVLGCFCEDSSLAPVNDMI